MSTNIYEQVRQASDIHIPVTPGPVLRKPILAPRPSVDFSNMARLATLPPQGYTSNADAGKVVIFLPHLPEDIEFSRDNNYDQAGNNPIMPDGLWIYQYTNPQEIPLAFTLHAFDELCPQGSQTLLDIAAKLQSLLLPANNQTLEDRATALAAGQSTAKAVSQELSSTSTNPKPGENNSGVMNQQTKKIAYPPACSLRLIQAGVRGLGVHCVGFVKNASVTFHGPYLQTEDGANSYNLPTAATYKFTFVHNPSYTNTLQMGKVVQALGPDIYSYFYNTGHLSPMAKNTYADVADLGIDRVKE